MKLASWPLAFMSGNGGIPLHVEAHKEQAVDHDLVAPVTTAHCLHLRIQSAPGLENPEGRFVNALKRVAWPSSCRVQPLGEVTEYEQWMLLWNVMKPFPTLIWPVRTARKYF